MALDFENRDSRGVILDRVPVLVPNCTPLTHSMRPPFLGRGHEILRSDINTGGVLRGAWRSAWIPAYISDLGTVYLTPGRTPPLPLTARTRR